jgi:eukaryotic-like serine/threonine-protein kinase
MVLSGLGLPPRYADAKLIGRGGMADIYAAEDTELGRRVAVKVLSERFAEDPDIRERFKREALTAARLSGHPNIATIFDVGETEGRPFIVMELVDGGSLADRIGAGPVPEEQALAWLGQAAAALDAAHAEGIVHRDVKPSNMLLDGQDDLKITDFGIALVLDEAATGVTATGTVLGTAGYLSPEQAAGQRATAASDIYALGVVAYELLTGERPFARASVAAEASAHINEPVEPPSERAGLASQADPVFARALAKDPSYRYTSAAELVQDLSAALRGEETVPLPVAAAGGGGAGATEVTRVAPPPARRARRVLPITGAALLLVGGALAAVVLTHSQTPASGGTPVTSQPRNHAHPPAPVPAVNPPPPPPAPHGKGKGHSKPKKHEKEKGHAAALVSSPGSTTSPGTTTQATTTTEPTTTAGTTTAQTTTVTTG